MELPVAGAGLEDVGPKENPLAAGFDWLLFPNSEPDEPVNNPVEGAFDADCWPKGLLTEFVFPKIDVPEDG
jgi:hypothetical protein